MELWKDNFCIIWGILLLDDGRFAIEMLKYWGDLRKFIDEKMQQNNNQSPPFTKEVAKLIIWDICKGDAKPPQGRDFAPRPQSSQRSH
jgi:hypothetical protein